MAPSPATAADPPGRWALVLGHAGLLPFVAGALAMVMDDPLPRAMAADALNAYAAVIVSFLGGIHWGLGMARSMPGPGPFLWGVVPSLVAWAAVLWDGRVGLGLMALMLLVCLAVDHRVYPRLGLAAWRPLRWRLSLVAALCCGVAALRL